MTTALCVVALVVGGCSDDEPAPSPPTSVAPVDPPWNPCSVLDTEAVIAQLGTSYSVRRGTPEVPACTFVPETEGDPVVDITYDSFSGSLTELLDQFGDADDTTITTPKVRGAGDARLIVTVSEDDTLRITGFVRNGVLVQVVNVLDPAPFDQDAVVADVRSVMTDLAAGAESSGLTGSASETPTPSASPTPSSTPTPSETLTPSVTPTPSETLTPSESLTASR